jgi:hypothetical protein
MLNIEMWKLDRSSVFLYCEDYSLVKELWKEFRAGTVYFKGGHPCGWQFLVPARLVRIIARKLDVELVQIH